MAHTFLDWFAPAVCDCPPKRYVNSAAATEPCDLSQSWSMREKPAVSGPLNSTALALCQDTASDGPGVNGRRAEDPHGGESASVAGGRKEGVRESA